VNGAPVFGAEWDLKCAIPWRYPEIGYRTYFAYNPLEGTLQWDGDRLGYRYGRTIAETHDIFLLQTAPPSFARATAPFAIRPDLTVETNPSR
jgi:hypothetical protein